MSTYLVITAQDRITMQADGVQVDGFGDLVLWQKTGRRLKPTHETARFVSGAWDAYERVSEVAG